MKIYIVNYQDKNGKELKKVVLKATNDLTGEEVFYSGFLKDLATPKQWGKSGELESYAEIYKDRPNKR
ncbi:MAG: hypothetical protein GBAus27B_000514 [Mycoplasmataceae bacterium]|nr:MAG: hypothetical protein GBAus27B_000514 [Mycoplasmataceae bacterium]